MIVGELENDLRMVKKINAKKELERLPLIGFYGVTGGHKGFLYRWRGKLSIRIDDGSPISVDDQFSFQWERRGDRAKYMIASGGKCLASDEYGLSQDVLKIRDDPTPCVEAEDFDFFLFVHNVAADRGRRDRIFR